jgi:predicted alpha/beta-hydrolase family hydrolase
MESVHTSEHRFAVSAKTGEVSAILRRGEGSQALLVLAHGAGAGMRHPFLEDLSHRLASRGLATFRYQFPYTEAGRRRPDRAPILVATVRAAVARATSLEPDLPLFAGGKSMGGRMSSLAFSEAPLEGVNGLVFFGFPLHPAGNPSTERAEHLSRASVPMLFLQGTRDRLADLELLQPICSRLGPRARLHVLEGGDHSFAVLKRSARTRDDMLEELAQTTASWTTEILQRG